MQLVSRDGDKAVPRDIIADETRDGDVVRIIDSPICEVDPATYAARPGVFQQFKINRQRAGTPKKPLEVVVELKW